MSFEIGDWKIEINGDSTLGRVFYKGNEIVVTNVTLILDARKTPVIQVSTLGIKDKR